MLAATKNRSVAEIMEAVQAGVGLIGENRVQELLDKTRSIPGEVEVHFIGHLQRNKVRQVVGMVELIHSVDSERLATEISSRAGSVSLVQDVLVQVNIAAEDSKFGVEPERLEGFLEALTGLENLRVVGLSTIAPYADDARDVRWVFRRLAELGAGMKEEIEGFDCRELSMGMTNDFEIAVEEGSTIVRIGTALFGARPPA